MKIMEDNSKGYIQNGVLVKHNGQAYENPINTASSKIKMLINQTGISFDENVKEGYFNDVDAILVGNSSEDQGSVFEIISKMIKSIYVNEIKGNSGVKKFVEGFTREVKNNDIDEVYDFLKSVKKYKKFRSRINSLVDVLVKLRVNYEKQKKKSLTNCGKESKFEKESIDKAKNALSDICKSTEKEEINNKIKSAFDALCAAARFDSKREAKTKKADSGKVKTGLIPWYNNNKKAKTTKQILDALINITDYIPKKEGLFGKSRLTKLKGVIEELSNFRDEFLKIVKANP